MDYKTETISNLYSVAALSWTTKLRLFQQFLLSFPLPFGITKLNVNINMGGEYGRKRCELPEYLAMHLIR